LECVHGQIYKESVRGVCTLNRCERERYSTCTVQYRRKGLDPGTWKGRGGKVKVEMV